MKTAASVSSLQVPSHALTVHLPDVPAAEARDRLRAALGHAGFSVLAEIDLADVLGRRIDRHIEPLYLFEVCRPEIAGRALAVASDASLIMPCKIAIWTEDKGSIVGTLPASRLVAALGRNHLDGVAAEVEQRLETVLENLWQPARKVPRPAATGATRSFPLSEGERAALVEALRQHRQALLVEAAGTESHDLQHELARTIDQLEGLLARLSPPRPAGTNGASPSGSQGS